MLGKYLSVVPVMTILFTIGLTAHTAGAATFSGTAVPPSGAIAHTAAVSRPAAFRPVSRIAEYRYVTIEQFRATAEAVGWGDVLDRLTLVALCEAGASSDGITLDLIDTMAESPAGDRGALQIGLANAQPGEAVERLGYDWDAMFVLVPNLRVGRAIYEARGNNFSAWGCG